MTHPPIDLTQPLMTVSQIASIFQVSKYTVREWIKSGELEAAKFGREWRASREEVTAFARRRYGYKEVSHESASN
jgi:excisionase family DNA binding protein